MARNTALILVTFSALLAVAAGVAVMSVDLGAEFMKIAIVKPGVPMEIATNKDSSRKTRTLVAFRDGERQFANQGYTTAVRFPKKAFWYLTHLVGRHFDDPQVELYKKRFPYYDLVKDEERGTVLFKLEDETTYSVEELLGMILEAAKEYAEEFADHPIKDAVITVPVYFNQAERRAVTSAANMVGLNVLQLMSDNAAVALNYGVFRRKNFNSSMQYYIFYDMGATSTVATVAGYQVVKMKEGTRMDTNPQVVIKGVGFDRTLGGLDLTLRLRDYLAKVFNEQKKTKKDVFTNNRAMAKLLKEADRVKTVLSANSDHYAQVEGLLDEQDFRAKVSREKLEELCEDLYPRVIKPLEEALKVSEITLGEVSDVILMGGATRSPRVQEEVMKFLGRTELGKSINTDESAAMGAVYQAAFLGKGFKVKTFGVKEGNMYPIVVEFEKHKNTEQGEKAKMVKRTLFGRMNPFPQKKVMTFNKHFTDFSFSVGYGELDFLSELDKKSFPQLLLTNISLSGVEGAYKKHEGSEGKGIKAHFRMDESGILHLDKVESVFEKTGDAAEEDQSAWSKIGSAIGGLFGGSDKKEESTVKDSQEVPKTGETKEESKDEKINKTESTEEETTDKKKSDKKKEKPETKDEQTDNTSDKKEKKKEKKEEKKSSDKGGKSGKEEAKDKKDEKEEKKNGKKEEKKEEEPKKPKIVTVKEEITTSVDVLDMPDHSEKKLKASKKKLSALKTRDREKADLEKAKNELEAYIFDSQDKLSQDNYVECSTETQREELNKLMSEASDWLYEQPDDAKKDVYEDKLKSLKKSMQDVVKRVYEVEERPRALEALKSMLNHSEYFLKSVKNLTTTEDPMFTEVEANALEKLINETYEWRKSNLAEQKKLKKYETPKMLVEDIAIKLQALDREVKYLLNKAKYWKPKAKPKKDNETTAEGEKKINETEKSDDNSTKTEETKDSETEETDSTGTTEEPQTQKETPPEATEEETEETKTEDKTDEEKLQIDASDSKTDEHTEL